MLDLEVVCLGAYIVQPRCCHLVGSLVPSTGLSTCKKAVSSPLDDTVRGDLPLRHELLVVADELEHQVARPRLDFRVHKERFVELSLSIQPPNDGAVLDGAKVGMVQVGVEISR